MTADLKAARADVESRIETWKSSGYISDRRVAASLSAILAALDQAAEALKPFAEEAFVWHGSYRNDYRPKIGEAQEDASYDIGDLRRAATVYATLTARDAS